MNKRFLSTLIFAMFIVFGCASNKPPLSVNEVQVLKEKSDIAIVNSKIREEYDLNSFKKLIRDLGYFNLYSEELLDVLNKRGYIEIDINKKFGEDVAKIFLENVFGEEYTFLSTEYRLTKVGGINFVLEYLSKHKQLPNIISFVYVSEDNNIRVFYKINYEFGYYSKGDLTDGTEILKFY